MGADGGVITTRQDMVRTAETSAHASAERERQASLSKSHWNECALTGLPLHSPIIVAKSGFFFNKTDLFEAIASKTLPRRLRALTRKGAIRELELLGSPSLVNYVCPLSAKSPSPGTTDPWIVLFKCGHLFHGPSFHEIGPTECPICGTALTDILDVSPSRHQ
jgi:hypothetical protein